MVSRVRHPGTAPRDIDMGPAVGRRRSWSAIRRVIDIAIAKPLPHADPCELWQPPR